MYSDNSFDTYFNKNEKMIESISVILDILSNKNIYFIIYSITRQFYPKLL